MRRGAVGGCPAAAAADLIEGAAVREFVAEEDYVHTLALEALASRGPHHLALLAVLEPVAPLEGLTRPREVDLLSYRVATRQRRWRLVAYLCAHTALVMCDELRGRGSWRRRVAVVGCAALGLPVRP